MIELLSYSFVQYALVAGLLVAMLCAIVGVAVVARNMSLLGDSLSHVSFAAATVSLYFGMPLIVFTIPMAILGALFVNHFSKKSPHTSDSMVAAISTTGVAIGVIVASLTKNVSIDLESFLFGSILTVNIEDILGLGVVLALVVTGFWIYKKDIFQLLFDEDEAKIRGVNVSLYQTLISITTGLTIALSMKIVGALLVSSLLVLPAFSAMRLANGFVKSVILSVVFAILSVVVGMFVSLSTNTPSGPMIALCASSIFIASLMISKN